MPNTGNALEHRMAPMSQATAWCSRWLRARAALPGRAELVWGRAARSTHAAQTRAASLRFSRQSRVRRAEGGQPLGAPPAGPAARRRAPTMQATSELHTQGRRWR
jgi:hypothetical protein